jgi:hypothetical protein
MFSTWLLYVSLIDARLWTVLGRLRKNSGCGRSSASALCSGPLFSLRALAPELAASQLIVLHLLPAAQKAVDHTARVVVSSRDLACRVNGFGERIGRASYVEHSESAVSLPQKAVSAIVTRDMARRVTTP